MKKTGRGSIRARIRDAGHEYLLPDGHASFDRVLASISTSVLDVWMDRAANAHVEGEHEFNGICHRSTSDCAAMAVASMIYETQLDPAVYPVRVMHHREVVDRFRTVESAQSFIAILEKSIPVDDYHIQVDGDV